MKKLFLFATAAMIFSFVSCSKSSGDEDDDQDPMVFTGNVTFYITKTPACEGMNLTLQTEDLTKTLYATINKSNITTTAPACEMTTGFTFRNLVYGKYKFMTSCGSKSTNGTLTINKDCTFQLVD